MIDKKLEVFSVLQQALEDFPQESKAYDCIKIMCIGTLDALRMNSNEKAVFSRWKLKALRDSSMAADSTDPKDLQKWIDDRQLSLCLKRIVIEQSRFFEKLGYIPVIKKNETRGGKGNERTYWLEIEQQVKQESHIEVEDDSKNTAMISYQRAKSETIKVSLLFRLIFKNGELKNRSIRGALLASAILVLLAIWLTYLLITSIVLVRNGESFTSFNLLTLLTIGLFSWSLWKYWLIPIWHLPDHRIIKAPFFFLALNEDDAEIEMYRDQYKSQNTRFTRFTATCPICAANVLLKNGYPYQKAPLVGRCVESPFAHVYSFDRVTLVGKRL